MIKLDHKGVIRMLKQSDVAHFDYRMNYNLRVKSLLKLLETAKKNLKKNMILNKNKVEEASQSFIIKEHLDGNSDMFYNETFKGGISYAESELSELFIDFLIWYETSDIQNRKLKYTAPIMGENFDIRKLAKEIFDIFLEERNKTSK